MLKLLPLLIKLWPVIKPILPVLLQLLRENRQLLEGLNARPDTVPPQDARDFFREIDKEDKWEPTKPYWEDGA